VNRLVVLNGPLSGLPDHAGNTAGSQSTLTEYPNIGADPPPVYRTTTGPTVGDVEVLRVGIADDVARGPGIVHDAIADNVAEAPRL